MLAYLILHYKNADVTQTCINALLRTVLDDAQIVVVDNASNNGSFEILLESFKDNNCIHFLSNESNLGYAAGNNVGFRYAKNELKANWIVLLNNDVNIEQYDFMQILMKEYSEENFYVAGPDIITPDGGSQNPFRYQCPNKRYVRKKLLHDRIVFVLMKMGIQQKIKKLLHYDGNTFLHNNESTIRDFKGVLHGSCLIFSPLFIERFNGFYEGTFLYCEEEILCYILNQLNCRYSYLKSIKVVHNHSVSMKREICNEDVRKMREISIRIISYKKMMQIMKSKDDLSKYLM